MSITKEKYSKMINSVIIKDIIIKNMELKDVQFPERDNCGFKVNLNYSCKDFRLYGENEYNDIIEFYPKFKLNIVCEDKETVNLKFELRATYQIDNINDYEDEYIIKFMENNLPVNIWPYAREIISSMTTRIGYPSLMIEPYRV